MAPADSAEQPEQWTTVGGQMAQGLLREIVGNDWVKFIGANGAEVGTQLLILALTLIAPIGTAFAKGIAKAEDAIAPELAEMAAAAISDVFGTEIPASAFRNKRSGPNGRGIGETLGDGFLNAIKGQGGALEPSDAAAKRFLGNIVNMSLEGWYQGWFFEFVSSLVPIGDVGRIESFAELDDTVAQALGLSRLSRRVISPLLDATVVAPFRWQINKSYRPELLGSGDAVRQFTRGRWSREQVFEELGRQGFSDERIEALIASALKMLSLDDALVLLRSGKWTRAEVIDVLKQQGYEPATAELVLVAALEKRLLAIRDDSLSAIRTAYVNREISEFEFSKFLEAIIPDGAERAAYEVAALTSRELNVKKLAHGEMKDAVKAGVLNFKDYRAWLTQQGYEADDQLTLELLLRADINVKLDIAKHRADAEAERAAEKLAKALAAAERKAQVDAERALHRRGSLAALERAVVRNLIPLSRYAEVLSAEYDADTVEILLGLVELDRQTYLAQQAAADDAKQRAARRNLDVGAIEQAVLARVLTIDEYRARLTQMKFDDSDVQILTSTLAAKLADRQAAEDKRRDAELAARSQSIDLGRFEQLVRKGVRTLAQYDALLASLHFDDAARADMRELLELKIADDAAAAAIRAQTKTTAPARGASLEQFRSAVIRGLKTPAEFQAFLVSQNYTADAIQLLMAELQDDLAQADAARQRRQSTDAEGGTRTLPLPTVRRAVQLSVISPDVYERRLIENGYTPDDVAIEMELLLTEIADVQAARARREQLNAQADAKGLSLSQVERAVKANVASLDDYRARALQLGYDTNDVFTLTQTLQQELEVQRDAQARHDAIEGQLQTRDLSLGQLDAAVKAGLKSLDEYSADLQRLGYGDDDADLLVSLLMTQLAAKQSAA